MPPVFGVFAPPPPSAAASGLSGLLPSAPSAHLPSASSGQPSCAPSSELPLQLAAKGPRNSPMPEPGPDVVPCSWDMGDARSAYFSRSKEQPVHLKDFDSDFGVFDTPSNQSGPPSPTKPPPWPSFPSSRLNFPPAQLSARIPQPSTWPQATTPPPQPNPPPSPPCPTSPPQLCAFYSNPRPSAPGASESSAAELAPRRNRWLDEDGALVLPQRHCSAVLLVSPVPC